MPADQPAARAILEQLKSLQEAACAERVFDGRGPEQLWSWQQQQNRLLRQALLLDFPAVYQAPKFESTSKQALSDGRVERGSLETETGLWLPIVCHDPGAWNGEVMILVAAEVTLQEALIDRLTEQGTAVVSMPPRAALMDDTKTSATLAEAYLQAGRTYVGSCVIDCVRTIDFVESRAQGSAEVVAIAGFDAGASIAAATMAVDKRVRGALLAGLSHSGSVLGMLGTGGQVGGVLAMLGCCAPRHVMVIEAPFVLPEVYDAVTRLYAECEEVERLRWGDFADISIVEQVEFVRQALA